MAKIIAFNEETRRGLEGGVKQVADAVKVTTDQRERTVGLDK